MVKLTPEVMEVVKKQKPLPIATADSSGKPNVVFVTTWKIIDDETIMVVDNFFKKTAENIKQNPRFSMVVYESESKKSYQVKGSADYLVEGAEYEEAKAMVAEKKLPGKAAVMLHMEEVYDAKPGPNAGERIA